MERFGLDLLQDRAVLRPHLEGLVGIDLIEHPQPVGHELEIVGLRAAGDLVQLLDAFFDRRRVCRDGARQRYAGGRRDRREAGKKGAARHVMFIRHTLPLGGGRERRPDAGGVYIAMEEAHHEG